MEPTGKRPSLTSLGDGSEGFEIIDNLNSDELSSDSAAKEAQSALRAFFGRKVAVRTGEPALPLETIPVKERRSFSNPVVLRKLSSLLSFGSSQGSKGNSDNMSGSDVGRASGDDKSEIVMDKEPQAQAIEGAEVEVLPTDVGHASGDDSWDWGMDKEPQAQAIEGAEVEVLPTDVGHGWVQVEPQAQAIEGAEVEVLPTDRVDVVVEDGELVQSLGKKTFASLPVEKDSLLPPQLSLGDICQSDQRSTCYILSAAAAYVFSEPGKEALRDMFTDKGNGVGVVKLYDDILSKDVFVQVSLNPVFVDKVLIYSFSSRGNVWPLALEKAIHGLNLAFVQAWEEQKEALSGDSGHRLRAELSSVLTEKDKAKLDGDDLASAMKRFPAVKGSAENASEYVQSAKLSSGEPFQHWITSSLQAGVPVVLGTRKLALSSGASFFKQIGRTLKSGTPTGHAVAVLKEHELKGKSRTRRGILVYDPYGEKKGLIPSDEEIRSDHFKPSANGPVQFVPWEDVPVRFSDVCFAKGAPQQHKRRTA